MLLLTIFWPNFFTHFLNQIFVGPKFCLTKLFLRKTFLDYLFNGPNFFWLIFFWQEFCFDHHDSYQFFWTTFFVPLFPKIIFGANFFGKHFVCTNIFWTKLFLPKWRWPQRGTKIRPNLDKAKFALSLAQLSPSLFLDVVFIYGDCPHT